MYGGLEGGGLLETVILSFLMLVFLFIIWFGRGLIGRFLDKISPFSFLNEGGSYKYKDFYEDITPKGQILWMLFGVIFMDIIFLVSFGLYWFSLVMIIVFTILFILFFRMNTFDDDFLELMKNDWKGTIILPDFDIGMNNNTAGFKVPKGIGFEAERGIPLINLILNRNQINPNEKEVSIKVLEEGIFINQISGDEFDKKILWKEVDYVDMFYANIMIGLKNQDDLEIGAPRSLGILKRFRFIIELKNYINKQIN